MSNDIKELRKKFNEIKKRGWIKSIRAGDGGIGRTFECLIGEEENSLEIADFNGIEIKTKRGYSKSYIGLFSMAPTGKYYHEIERIKSKYGYPDKILKECKVLNNSVFCNIRTTIGIQYQFMLKVDWNDQKIYLYIFDRMGALIEKDIYWDFDIIKEKLYRKLKTLAYIKAKSKFINKIEYFQYYDMKIYTLKNFESFVYLMEQGVIRISFKISVFRTGKRKGKIHDRGTSFDIQEKDLLKLYNLYQET